MEYLNDVQFLLISFMVKIQNVSEFYQKFINTILKSKFKQWWSTIPQMSIKSNYYLSPQIIEHKKKTTIYGKNWFGTGTKMWYG